MISPILVVRSVSEVPLFSKAISKKKCRRNSFLSSSLCMILIDGVLKNLNNDLNWTGGRLLMKMAGSIREILDYGCLVVV